MDTAVQAGERRKQAGKIPHCCDHSVRAATALEA
jgi:hypothetical protein